MFDRLSRRSRRPSDDEIARELRDHLELEAEVTGGTGDEAAASARRRFGNLSRTSEDVRAIWRAACWDHVRADMRIAFRTLRRSKAFATFSILALALAITANTTMSSLIDAIIHPEMAFPHPEQLVLARFDKAPDLPGDAPPHPTGADLHQVLGTSGRTYSAASMWLDDGMSPPVAIQTGTQHLRVTETDIAGNFFDVVGTRPLYGTLFHDSTAVGQRVVVISERLWRQISDGRQTFAPFALSILWPASTATYTVIGVVPHDGAPPVNTDLFLPSGYAREVALLRLRPGFSREALLAELNVLAARLDPHHSRLAHFDLTPAVVSPARNLDLVAALAAATFAVLLIACANIANLLVARGMARSRELATRMALGASRWQVARLLFAESGLIAVAGGTLGVLLSLWTIHILSATLPANLQYLGLVEPQLSWRVVAAGMGLTVVAAAALGVAPVVGLMRADVGTILKGASGRNITGSLSRFRLLVVAEVAGALTLIVSASMLGAVAGRIRIVHYGYDANHLLQVEVREASLQPGNVGDYGRPPTEAVVAKRYDELQRLRAMPGVVAATAQWPWFIGGRIRIDDPGGGEPLTLTAAARIAEVAPNYLRALRIPVVRGRDFHTSEDGPLPSVIIDQIAAHWLWPGADPIGRLMEFSPQGPWMRVVGVIRQPIFSIECVEGPCSEPTILIANGAAYRPRMRATQYVIRTKGDPSAFVGRLRQQMAADYPSGVPAIATWDDVTGFAPVTKMYDFVGSLFGLFAAIGMLLALIGVYGVAAYAAEQRAREFGVRIALGAQARDIVRLVLHDGNATALLGLAVGLIFANWAESLLAHYLFGYDALAPAFMLGAMVALFGATVAAGIPPALRAARVNPVDTLRAE